MSSNVSNGMDSKKDLHSIYPEEADQLLAFESHVRKLGVRPARSPRAKQAGWNVIEEVMQAQPARNGWWSAKRLAAIPALLVVALGATVIISQSAMPGDAAYSIKRETETIQLALTTSDAKKAELCSMYMKRRANELARLDARSSNGRTVAQLTSAVEEEAVEYAEYTATAGPAAAALKVQGVRDAQYVIAALEDSMQVQTSPDSQKAISATIAAMNRFIENI